MPSYTYTTTRDPYYDYDLTPQQTYNELTRYTPPTRYEPSDHESDHDDYPYPPRTQKHKHTRTTTTTKHKDKHTTTTKPVTETYNLWNYPGTSTTTTTPCPCGCGCGTEETTESHHHCYRRYTRKTTHVKPESPRGWEVKAEFSIRRPRDEGYYCSSGRRSYYRAAEDSSDEEYRSREREYVRESDVYSRRSRRRVEEEWRPLSGFRHFW